MAELKEQVKKIESEFYESNPTFVLCHLDLHCHNMMRHNGKVKLVDYGMTGPDHPFLDLAVFGMYQNLSDREEKELLQHYLGEAFTEEKWEEYLNLRPIVYLNKVIYPIKKGLEMLGGTRDQLLAVWKEESVGKLSDYFQNIYSSEQRTAVQEFQYSRTAYEKFMNIS